jgi:hypothetical protein
VFTRLYSGDDYYHPRKLAYCVLLGTVPPEVRERQRVLLHDIVANPFHPVFFDPTWRAPNVLAVAQVIYEDRRFEDMPILADALEDTGCTSEDILSHCRSPGPHVRGCWVVDLILSKDR